MRQSASRRIAWVLVVAILYAGAVVGLDIFDWGLGHLRALILGMTAVALFQLGIEPAGAVPRLISRAIAVLLLAILAVRAAEAARAYRSDAYRPIDVATTTLVAMALTEMHTSPYTKVLDPRPETMARSGFGFFDGYKYGPMNVLLYYPLTRPCGIAGIYLTNFVFYVATAALLVALGRTFFPSGDPTAGLAASLLFVATPFVWRESAVQGVNDGVQAALLLGAILLRVKRRAAFAGVVVGMAMACKMMPAAALLIALLPLPRRLHFIISTAVTAGLLFMTQFPAAPKEMIANLVLWHVNRVPDSTGLRYFLPSWLAAAWPLLVFGALAVLATRHLARRDVSPAEIVRFLALFLAVFYLSSNAHRNYLVWFVPLLALEAATLALRERSEGDATPPSS